MLKLQPKIFSGNTKFITKENKFVHGSPPIIIKDCTLTISDITEMTASASGGGNWLQYAGFGSNQQEWIVDWSSYTDGLLDLNGTYRGVLQSAVPGHVPDISDTVLDPDSVIDLIASGKTRLEIRRLAKNWYWRMPVISFDYELHTDLEYELPTSRYGDDNTCSGTTYSGTLSDTINSEMYLDTGSILFSAGISSGLNFPIGIGSLVPSGVCPITVYANAYNQFVNAYTGYGLGGWSGTSPFGFSQSYLDTPWNEIAYVVSCSSYTETQCNVSSVACVDQTYTLSYTNFHESYTVNQSYTDFTSKQNFIAHTF